MMMEKIVKREEGAVAFIKRYSWSEGDHESGLRLTMESGEIWFHPYSGRSPIKERGSA